MDTYLTRSEWNEQRLQALVVACSDGRLREALDDFLHSGLGLVRYDRLYVPGGGGALVSSGVELIRPDQIRQECCFLLQAHAIQTLHLIFHGPAESGPEEAVCGDYRRKFSHASAGEVRQRQDHDAAELKRMDWGKAVRVCAFRCEVQADATVQFLEL